VDGHYGHKFKREARLHQKSGGRPIILVNTVHRILPRILVLELVLLNAPFYLLRFLDFILF
jgi:hypothetical protein